MWVCDNLIARLRLGHLFEDGETPVSAFIWIALHAIGIPDRVIRSIKALYVNNIHFVNGVFGLQFAFVAASGVRQGCPLSSVLFILVTDCILTALCQTLGPRDILRGYADDIGMVPQNPIID